MMFLFQFKYRKYLAVTLVILMAIPCSAKLEMKKQLHVDTSQQSNTSQVKIACITYQVLGQSTKKVNAQNSKHPIFALPRPFSLLNGANKIKLPTIFKGQKEKVPTYLYNARFLI